jgi:hypothetical protein
VALPAMMDSTPLRSSGVMAWLSWPPPSPNLASFTPAVEIQNVCKVRPRVLLCLFIVVSSSLRLPLHMWQPPSSRLVSFTLAAHVHAHCCTSSCAPYASQANTGYLEPGALQWLQHATYTPSTDFCSSTGSSSQTLLLTAAPHGPPCRFGCIHSSVSATVCCTSCISRKTGC